MKVLIRKIINKSFKKFFTYNMQNQNNDKELINLKSLELFTITEELINYIFEHFHL